MPQKYVVQYNEETQLYLTAVHGALEYENCEWGSVENAIEFESDEEARVITTAINSGTLGVPKP